MAKPKRTFADLKAGYARYNPAEEGYGDPESWKGAFQERMGIAEAQEVLGTKGPRAVLGVSTTATWTDIAKAYRKKLFEVHPDRIATSGLTLEEATRRLKEVNAAYALLAKEFGKLGEDGESVLIHR